MSPFRLCWRALKALFVIAPKRTALVTALLAIGFAALAKSLCWTRPPPKTCEDLASRWLPTTPVELEFEFLDDDLGKLDRARHALEARGYAFSKVYRGVCSDCPTMTLQMKKTVAFTPASFCTRRAELDVFVEKQGLLAFWGAFPSDPNIRDAWGDAVESIR